MSDLALNNVDEFIFDNSMRMDERKTPFLKKYVAELKDNNTSRDYSGNQLVFDNSAISMSGSYVDWAHGVLEIPAVCVVSGGNGAGFNTPISFTEAELGAESDFLIALKNAINIFDSFQVEFNSVQVVNATTYINAYLNMRLNTELSESDERLHGDAFNFYKDNSSSWIYSDAASSSGRGMTNNRNSFFKVQSCSSNTDELFNEGMMKRQLKMVNQTAPKNGRNQLMKDGDAKTFNLDYIEHNADYLAYYYTILIPLNWLYFFKELPLIRNGNMKITFSLNANCGVQITKSTGGLLNYVSFQGSNNTFPVMVGASNVKIKTSKTNAVVVAGNNTYKTNTAALDIAGCDDMVVACGSSNIPITSAATLYISFSVVKCNSSIGSAAKPHSSFGLQCKKSQCRILVPTYQFSPQYQQIADSITEKKIPFLNVVGGQIFNCLPNSTFDKVIVQSIARAKRLIIIPYLSQGAFGNGTAIDGTGTPFSEWKSPFSSSPSTTAPVLPLLSNMQITIASVIPVYQNPVNIYYEHYLNEVQSTGLNFGLLTGCSSSTISMKDHANCYGYFIAKLDRRLPQDENVPISIQITGMNNCLKALDLYCYVEYMDESFCINPNTGQKLVAV